MSMVPKRMIEIPQEPEKPLRLVPASEAIQFAALSYCWGQTQQAITTSDNVSQRSNCINESDLPRTLQDAILLTRRLQIPYLWVDSLCIVQNDDEEWAEEAAKMEYIFSVARIVIAATAAKDSSQGFLTSRQAPHSLDMGQHGTISGNMLLYARRVDNHKENFKLDISHLPIFKRAWCMQEISLACRVVHFLPDEIVWICRSTAECECGLLSQNSSGVDTYGWNLTSASLQMIDEISFVQLWMKIVEGFSALEITHKRDLLPAISGLARRMEKFDPGKYVAGLWAKDIVQQLLWTIWPCRGERSIEAIEALGGLGVGAFAHEDALEYPSFSWISAPAEIRFCRQSTEHLVLCQMISIESTPQTNDPYGRILRASIVLEGHFISGYELEAAAQGCERSGSGRRLRSLGTLHLDRSFIDQLDSETASRMRKELDLSKVVCLALTCEDDEVNALLLERRTDGASFTRIGLVEGLRKSVFDENGSKMTATII